MNSYFMELLIRQSDSIGMLALNIEQHTRTKNSNEILVHIIASAPAATTDRENMYWTFVLGIYQILTEKWGLFPSFHIGGIRPPFVYSQSITEHH